VWLSATLGYLGHEKVRCSRSRFGVVVVVVSNQLNEKKKELPIKSTKYLLSKKVV
jgi:hypothetical protein